MHIPKKAVPLQPHFGNEVLTLGYGVMVTLQILVLSFLVRVRVPQHKKRLPGWKPFLMSVHHLFFLTVLCVNRFDLVTNELYLILQFLHLAVHLVNKGVTLLRGSIEETEVVLVGLHL